MGEGAHIQITVPYPLREYTRGQEIVDLRAATLADAIGELDAKFPGIGYRLLDDQGRLRRYVLAFVNEAPVTHLEPGAVPLREGDTVRILPSVAGG